MVIEISLREHNPHKEILPTGLSGSLLASKIVLVSPFVNLDIKKKVTCFHFIYYKCVRSHQK